MTVCQPPDVQLTLRNRGQAPSHRGTVFWSRSVFSSRRTAHPPVRRFSPR